MAIRGLMHRSRPDTGHRPKLPPGPVAGAVVTQRPSVFASRILLQRNDLMSLAPRQRGLRQPSVSSLFARPWPQSRLAGPHLGSIRPVPTRVVPDGLLPCRSRAVATTAIRTMRYQHRSAPDALVTGCPSQMHVKDCRIVPQETPTGFVLREEGVTHHTNHSADTNADSLVGALSEAADS
jgi:hypothetical protein